MSDNSKARKPRKKKVAAPQKEAAQESIAPQTTPQQEEKAVRYKCLECGNLQSTKVCNRCGGHILREV